jgi:hypothetical protein
MTKISAKPIPEFRVLNYRYEEPDIMPDEKNSQYDFTYEYQFPPPYTVFTVVLDIYLILKNGTCYSEIGTMTTFDFPKEKWIKMGVLTDSGELIDTESQRLPESIGELIGTAFSMSQDAVTVRQINTKCEGVDMHKMDMRGLRDDIERRIKRIFH